LAKTKIRDTEWYDIVFPKPKTDEERAREKELDKMLTQMKPDLPKIEEFFNQVFPSIDWKNAK
jgi:hypothetical protein